MSYNQLLAVQHQLSQELDQINKKLPKLPAGGIDVYPDFTLRHPVTGEAFYREHIGRSDDSVYRASFLDKLNLYLAHGIIPDQNLILTWETGDHPLSAKEVEQKIHRFF